MTDHDHGLGLSGLRRIRQHAPPIRGPTLPSDPSSRSSFVLPRSVSMTAMLQQPMPFPASNEASSPAFTEDLSRFPSESLHSFSFAHQSSDLLHNNQTAFRRSMEFMKERMSLSASSNAGLASAQARASGDVETQNTLELLARAQLVGATNLPGADPSLSTALLTAPPDVSGENVFESSFIPRSTSPESFLESPLLMAKGSTHHGEASSHLRVEDDRKASSSAGSEVIGPLDSSGSSRTPTNESGTTQMTSPPTISRRPSLLLRRTLTDVTPVVVQQRLLDALATPFISPPPPQAAAVGGVSPRSLSVSVDAQSDSTAAAPLSATAQSFASPISVPGNLGTIGHPHATRWVPAAQAIFTTEAKPPWTIIAANDLACLVFGVTKAEVRRMGILEVVQEERRSWLEKKLLNADPDDDDGHVHSHGGEISQPTPKPAVNISNLLGSRSGGITAKLLSKPNSRARQAAQNGSSDSLSMRLAPRAKTIHGNDSKPPKPAINGHHNNHKSRGVLLCGDVVPIQKRNGATGSASLWVKEKRVGLIWVLEEIHEDFASVAVDDEGLVVSVSGSTGPIWGDENMTPGLDISKLIPRIPRQGFNSWSGPVDFAEVSRRKYFTCRNSSRVNIPATVEQVRGQPSLRISSFPHIAGIVVVSTRSLTIKSSNSVFCGALFGYEKPAGLSINQLIPDFDKILQILIEVDNVHMVDGIVVPEHSFRKASAFVALREGRPDAATSFLRPGGLPARHRDGSELKIDVQMRVVKSEQQTRIHEETVVEASDEDESEASSVITSTASPPPTFAVSQSEMVYALWITYSRHLHATRNNLGAASPLLSGAATPLHKPSPGQTPVHSPFEAPPVPSDDRLDLVKEKTSAVQSLTRQLREAAMGTASKIANTLSRPSSTEPLADGDAKLRNRKSTSPSMLRMSTRRDAPQSPSAAVAIVTPVVTITSATPSSAASDLASLSKTASSPSASPSPPHPPPTYGLDSTATMMAAQNGDVSPADVAKLTAEMSHKKKTIDDFVILEEMGQGAYGQVKLAKNKVSGKRVVIKYVTKKRILVDTWTRDRRLGTVPLEIHVLDYLRRDGLRHPNIVEMEDFFEDEINYYIEMTPHGLPGMDLFDYIELRTNMEEQECQSIFVQVARAIHHLHTKALVVHRDIKDENIILDGEGNIKLIDFGSASYIKSGPFDVFVGTIGTFFFSDVDLGHV